MKTYYSLFLLLLLSSCSPTEEPTSQKNNPPVTTVTKDSIKEKPSLEPVATLDLDTILEHFLAEVRVLPFSKITDSLLAEKKVPYLNFFPKEGLSKITLYTNQKAQQKKKLRYTDLYLTSLAYQSDSLAIQAFETIKTDVEFLITPAARGSLEKEEQYKTSRYIDPYHGGFIVRKNNRVLSLEKKCGGNQLKLNFKAYEKLFLKRLDHQKEDSEIIKANCGDMKFEILIDYK